MAQRLPVADPRGSLGDCPTNGSFMQMCLVLVIIEEETNIGKKNSK